MDDCIFCKILSDPQLGSFVYRDDWVTAFLDIHPVNAGHVLVVPNCHAASLSELDEVYGMHIFQAAQRVTAALYASGLPCEGVNFFLANGEAAWQDVFHVHLHVIPRLTQDVIAPCFLERYDEAAASRAELDGVAQKIREKM
jgi:histidine triad (HIT) family protein